MAATGVLPFVRGIDLTKNDFMVETISIQIDLKVQLN
jgi:hypothetical protein